jgi:hypothetical protein
METPAAKPKAKAGADIQVFRCLNAECRALLAYEVDSNNVLYIDLAWSAARDGDVRYFPCPKCGGRNIVEPFTDDKGKARHRVTRFAPAPV